MLLGAACFTALGIGFTRLLPNADSAGPVQAAVVMPIAFISGTFFPLDDAPDLLTKVASLFPPQPLADALQTAFDPHTHGAGFGYRRPTLARDVEGARMALEAAGIEAEVDVPDAALPPDAEAVLAWAVREGTTNVIRHSGAQRERAERLGGRVEAGPRPKAASGCASR